MKYQIGNRTHRAQSPRRRPLRLCGRQTARRIAYERIRLSSLFEVAQLPEVRRPSLWHRFRRHLHAPGRHLQRLLSAWRARCRKVEKPPLLPALCGALCGACTVCLLCGATVLYVLIFSRYYGSYRDVTVPSLVGERIENAQVDSSPFHMAITYQYDDEIPKGTVLSQSPAGGVTRRLRKHETGTLSLVVSLGRRYVTLDDCCGMWERDAALRLKNQGIRIRTEEVYSESAPKGTVIRTSPAAGESIREDQTVTLTVSLGKELRTWRVPDLLGRSESEAADLLRREGILLYEVTYVQSSHAAGTVIAQSPAPHGQIREGETLSFTVSAGYAYSQQTVPDLYGMSPEEAKQALSEAGLVCGKIYAVPGSGAPGTVISQSPAPHTPITSALTAVDLYICA